MKKTLVIICFLFAVISLHAQIFQQLTKLVASDRAADNNLGTAVAISGNYAVVAGSEIPSKGMPSNCNCVYVFEKNSTGQWLQKQKLAPPQGMSNESFGFSVTISGNIIAIGAPRINKGAGVVLIYERNSSGVWNFATQLLAYDGKESDQFGYSVSMSGDRLIIGAPGQDSDIGLPDVTDGGAAYLFENFYGRNWGIWVKLVAPDRSPGASFGYAVSISGEYMVVGAPSEKKDTAHVSAMSTWDEGENPLEGAGAAYIYKGAKTNYRDMFVHKIVYWDRAAGDQFGYSVSISGDEIVVGAPFEDEDANQTNTLISAGSAHIFERKVDGRFWWTEMLLPRDRAAGDNFGVSVSASGDMVLIGAATADEIVGGTKQSNSGAAYLFNLSTDTLAAWRQLKLTANDRTAEDWFGYAVGMDNGNIMVGAPFQDKNETRLVTTDAGAIYVFGKGACSITTSSISAIACKTYKSPSNKYTWTKSGTYKDTVLNNAGCDSIITINLTITNKADTTVTVKGKTLTANANDATYQWIDCATNQAMNITTRSLIVTSNGSYKVRVDQNGCQGTSSCHKVVLIAAIDSSKNTNPPVTILPRNKAKQKAFLEVNKIVAKDRTHNDAFGTSVSISGNYAVIGAPSDDDDEKGGSVLGAGSAYIFRLDDGGKWKQMQKISAFDRIPGAAFGCAVGISGNYLVVGANRDNLGVNGLYDSYLAGSAYVFQLVNGTWSFQQKIIANPTARVQQGQAFFGSSVAIDGTTIVIGCPDHQLDPTDQVGSSISSAGALFVYQLTTQKITEGGTEKSINGWVQTQKLVAKDRVIGNNLGNSVAICGDNIIAGSWGNDYDAQNANRMETAGAAYIFERQGGLWVQTQKLVAEDRSPYDEFGCSVGISGDYAVVGARRVTLNKGDDAMDDYTGNAYIFKRNSSGVGWSQQMKINPDDRTKWDYLGTAVGISGDYLIASAWGQDTDSLGNYMADAGAIYVYYLDKKGNWVPSDKVSPFYKHQLGHFGVAAAISDCNIIGSSSTDQTDEEDNDAISGTGAAYIFTAANCNNNGRCNPPSLPQNKIPKLINSDTTKIKKFQSGNQNAKGNDVSIDNLGLNDGGLTSTNTIIGPKTKAESVKETNSYNRKSIQLCIDYIKTESLPPKPPSDVYRFVPEINPDGTVEETPGVIKQELSALTDKMWNPGDVITVGFYPNQTTNFVINKVKQYAVVWENIANIRFRFVATTTGADVKVGFDTTDGSWSWVGRDVLLNPLNKKTMNFGWLNDTTHEDEFSRVIVHEFGHAIGFIHEHQAPTGGIQWDKEKVYSYFAAPPNNWSKATVDKQIFAKYSISETNSSIYDSRSIMHYYFPPDLTTNGFSFSKNTQLSKMDTDFVRLVYPLPFDPKDASGILYTGDDCDEIAFVVDYNASGVAKDEVDFILEPGIDHHGNWVTWWKKIAIPLKGGGEAGLEIENKSVSNRKFKLSLLDNTLPIRFWKAKFLGVHTLLDKKWYLLPAIIGGCRVRLTWRRDTCL